MGATLKGNHRSVGHRGYKLTRWQVRHLRMALYSAIELEESSVAAHHIKYNRRGPHLPNEVPAEYKAEVAACKRRASAYRKLLEALSARP